MSITPTPPSREKRSLLKAAFFIVCALLSITGFYLSVSNRFIFALMAGLSFFMSLLQLGRIQSWFFDDVIKPLNVFFESHAKKVWDGTKWLGRKTWSRRDYILLLVIILLILHDLIHLPTPPPPPSPPCRLSQCFSITAMQVDENGNGMLGLVNVGISMENSSQPFVFNQYDAYNHHAEQKIEGSISQENRRYPTAPYVTLILVTALSQTITDPHLSSSVGLSDLRGAYMAQYNYNHDISNTIKLRLYIANIGTRAGAPRTIPTVMRQIMAYANSDPEHFIGVAGFPFSSSAVVALHLNTKDIPIVSSSASSDQLSQFLHFHRIVPSDSVESNVMAAFLSSNIAPSSTPTALFLDDGLQCNTNGNLSPNPQDSKGEPYSKDLGDDIFTSFNSVIKLSYQEGNPDSLNNCVQNVKNGGYSQIFFAGFADDLNALRNKLKEQGVQNVRIIGGEGLYDLGAYDPGNYDNLLFTTFAAYAEIDPLTTNLSIPTKLDNIPPKPDCPKEPLFNWEFCQFFSVPNPPSVYGYDLPEMHTLLTYDAVNAFIHALPSINRANTPVWQTIDGNLSNVQFNGVTGPIRFSTTSDPVNKPVYVACTTNTGLTQLVATYHTNGLQPVQPPASFHKEALNACLSPS